MRRVVVQESVTNGLIKQFSPTWDKALITTFIQISFLECDAVYVRSNILQGLADFIDNLEVSWKRQLSRCLLTHLCGCDVSRNFEEQEQCCERYLEIGRYCSLEFYRKNLGGVHTQRNEGLWYIREYSCKGYRGKILFRKGHFKFSRWNWGQASLVPYIGKKLKQSHYRPG
jgi:hypothetical protein